MRLQARLAVTLVLLSGFGCGGADRTNGSASPSTLRIGIGSASGADPQFGIQQVINNIVLERLVNTGIDGRPRAVVAENWTTSPDGLTVRIALRPTASFHDGSAVTAAVVRDALVKRLPQNLGPAYDDISSINTVGDEIEIALKQRTTFLIDGLDVDITKPGAPTAGTGPYYVTSSNAGVTEMAANTRYYRGKPAIDRIAIKPYSSLRAAWADLLRGQVDMLYDVGIDALDSLESSTEIKMFPFQRAYAYLVILNVRRGFLKDPALRQALNAAVDRTALLRDAMGGHGSTADTPVWPQNWAFDNGAPRFRYDPKPVTGRPIRFTCLLADASLERMGIALQAQLHAIGVEMELQLVSGDQWFMRVGRGDFDAALSDIAQGPSLARPYLFWHTGSPYNWGGFSNPAVDAALDRIRHAPSDADYKEGVAAFQRAMVEDPPAIFLAWRERVRAVSRRFEVPEEPGRDILSSLRLWRPVAPAATGQLAGSN